MYQLANGLRDLKKLQQDYIYIFCTGKARTFRAKTETTVSAYTTSNYSESNTQAIDAM